MREATSGLLEHRADALGGGRGLEGGEPLLEQRGWVHMTASAMAEGLVRERSLQSRTRVSSDGAAGNPPCSMPTAALSERWPSTHLSL